MKTAGKQVGRSVGWRSNRGTCDCSGDTGTAVPGYEPRGSGRECLGRCGT
jgi:hypothetical protein